MMVTMPVWLWLLLIQGEITDQVFGEHPPGPLSVGIRFMVLEDERRFMPAPGDQGEWSWKQRILSAAMWYPIEDPQPARPLTLAQLLQLTERPGAPHFGREFMERRAAWEKGGVAAEAIERHLQQPTRAFLDRPAASAITHMIILAPMPLSPLFSNYVLAEFLASHGYLVISFQPFGWGANMMDTGVADVAEQVQDLRFIRAWAMDRFPDMEGVGLVGHSWSGLVALATAGEPWVKAVVSLDGSEEYWRDVIRTFLDQQGGHPGAPYLRIQQPEAADFGLFENLRHPSAYRLSLPHLSHSAFGSWSHVVRSLKGTGKPQSKAAYFVLMDAVLWFLGAHLKGQNEDLQLWQDFLAGYANGKAALGQLEQTQIAQAPPTLQQVLKAGKTKEVNAFGAWLKGLREEGRLPGAAVLLRASELFLWNLEHYPQTEMTLRWALLQYPTHGGLHEIMAFYHEYQGQFSLAAHHHRLAHQFSPDRLRSGHFLREQSEAERQE